MKTIIKYLAIWLLMAGSAFAEEDFALFIKESMVNKAIASKKVWEWKDSKNGLNLKLKNLKFSFKDGYILGIADLDEIKGVSSGLGGTVDRLIKGASQSANVQLITQVGLSVDHKKIILQNTKFTKFDNKYLPAFVENAFILSEINRRFAKEIDGKIIYQFPQNMPLDINVLKTTHESIQVYGDLLMTNSQAKLE